MFTELLQVIRSKTRSKAVLVGLVALGLAFAGGWALAGFGAGHGKGVTSLASARLDTHSPAGSTGAGSAPNASGPQAGAPQAAAALGPEGTKKPGGRSGHRNSTTCPPAPGTTVKGGLVVDGDCVITGVTINGGIVITGTGHLTIYKSTVNGGTTVRPGGEFDSDNPPIAGGGNTLNGGVSADHAFDLDIFNSAVAGRILLNGGPTGVGFFFEICGMTLQGDLTIENLTGATEIGDLPATFCHVNTISGSVHILNDFSSGVEVEKATIGGSVEISNSKPTLTGNTIGGSLLCHKGATLGHYDVDDTNTNQVHGTNTCV